MKTTPTIPIAIKGTLTEFWLNADNFPSQGTSIIIQSNPNTIAITPATLAINRGGLHLFIAAPNSANPKIQIVNTIQLIVCLVIVSNQFVLV
ncbi:hypothetical protein ACFL3G_12480, partial [Planctomycetota bacterium]